LEASRQHKHEADRLRGVVDLLQRKYNELVGQQAARDEAVSDLQHTVESLEAEVAEANQLTAKMSAVKDELEAAVEELGQIDELISRYSRDETQQRTSLQGVQELIEACLKMQAKVTGAEKAAREVQEELALQISQLQETEHHAEEDKKGLAAELEETKREAGALQVRILELEVETDSRVSNMQVEHHTEVSQLKDKIFGLEQLAEKEVRQRPPTDSEGIICCSSVLFFFFFHLLFPAFFHSKAQQLIRSLKLEIEILKKTVAKKEIELESTQFALDDG